MPWLALAACLICTIGAQLSFKSYHMRRQPARLLLTLALFALVVPSTMLAVRGLGVGRVYATAAITYVATPLLAIRMFAERIGRLQFVGLALIVAGVLVYNMP